MKAFRNLTMALAVFALGTGVALAQVSATTGAISGTAADETGAVLPGVTVTASSPSMLGQQVTYTDAGGSYRIPAIPPATANQARIMCSTGRSEVLGASLMHWQGRRPDGNQAGGLPVPGFGRVRGDRAEAS